MDVLKTLWPDAAPWLALIATFGGGLITVIGVWLAADALLLNLKRPRLEMATSLLYNWSRDLDAQDNRAIRFLTELLTPTEGPEETSDAGRAEARQRALKAAEPLVDGIYAGDPVQLDARHHDAILTILSEGFPEDRLPERPWGRRQDFWITAEHSIFIRFQWITWLNKIEAILTAWDTGAADPKRMGMTFGPLIDALANELEVLDLVASLKTQLPVLFNFHEQLRYPEDPRITVYPELFVGPRFLRSEKFRFTSRAITWRPERARQPSGMVPSTTAQG